MTDETKRDGVSSVASREALPAAEAERQPEQPQSDKGADSHGGSISDGSAQQSEVAAAIRDRDALWCGAILHADLKEVQKILHWLNENKPEAVPDAYYCHRCGYWGPTGGWHKGCNYSAFLVKGKTATHLAAQPQSRGTEEQSRPDALGGGNGGGK